MLNAQNLIVVVVSGLTLGSLYCLMSMGLTLTFSTLKIFNFSHGAFIGMGAYLTYLFLITSGLNYFLSIVLTLLAAFVIGAVIQRSLLNQLLKKGDMQIIIGTLGIALLLENLTLLIYGGRNRRLPLPIEGVGSFLGTNISYSELLIFACALSVLLMMAFFLKKTRLGMAMRAVAQDEDASYVVGIPVKRVNMYAFGTSAALGALAGVFLGSIYFMSPSMGTEVLGKTFIIVVLGGLGSINGTILAAYIVGFVESITQLAIGIYWTPLVLFVLMMLIIILRPAGLFGKDTR